MFTYDLFDFNLYPPSIASRFIPAYTFGEGKIPTPNELKQLNCNILFKIKRNNKIILKPFKGCK